MGFETPAIKPKIEKKSDLYDLAKKDMAMEKLKESKNAPEEIPEKLAEEERIGEEIITQVQEEGGVMQKMGDWAREQIREKTAKGKILIAALGMFAGTTVLAGNFSKAEARGNDFGEQISRDLGRAIGGVIRDVFKGVGNWGKNKAERGGSGETPREQEKRIERRRREISEQDRRYNRMQEEVIRRFTRSLQHERNRDGEVIPDEIREEHVKNLKVSLQKIDELHKKENHPPEECMYKQVQAEDVPTN